MAPMKAHCDIFCRVIDNLGDIGVCWRLARQLQAEHNLSVRLWLDDLTALAPLYPGIDPARGRQWAAGIDLRQWPEDFPEVEAADLVIEAFACDLPPVYLAAMAARRRTPNWINLEYLSAEDWVEGCHGLASPHPTLPLTKYFFFPGFGPGTGGLLRERGLLEQTTHWLPAGLPDALAVSLFCYDTAPVAALLSAWIDGPAPVCCLVPLGKPRQAVARFTGRDGEWQKGALTVRPIPFLPQADYDHLLRGCAVNFIRGEDSFVRAQWAAKPFVWQIYAQEEDVHLDKLNAFLGRYTQHAPAAARQAILDLHQAWNKDGDVALAWREFHAQLPAISHHNAKWAAHLATYPDLAAALVKFCADKL